MRAEIIKTILAAPGLLALCAAQEAVGMRRGVIDNERGFYYTYSQRWGDIGGYVGLPRSAFFQEMQPAALKGAHGRFQHVTPLDQGGLAFFPYWELKTWESQELASGRGPVFVTAEYQGRKRPVIFEWSANSEFGNMEAVNFRDERFIEFWIHRYVREILWSPRYPQMWVGIDNGAWDYNLYGVFDDRGKFVPGVRWDAGFPQNDDEFLEAVKHFLRRVKELAPDISIIINGMHLRDGSRFAELWNDVDGIILEDFISAGSDNEYGPSDWQRERFYDTFARASWAGAAGKVQVFQFAMAPDAPPMRLRTGYLAYLIFRGENSFFGPLFSSDNFEVPPERYAGMKDALGAPVSPAQDSPAPGLTAFGRRLYWRSCEGGIVYLNWAGREQRVTLPSDRPYYDRNGDRVSAIVIPDRQGDHVLTNPGLRAAKPSIDPRRTGVVTGPLPIALSTTTPKARIHYTLDGSEPTRSSPVYDRPLILDHSATVKARSVGDGLSDSFVSAASYIITDAPPSVGFHLAEFKGNPTIGQHYPLVGLSHASGLPVSVGYTLSEGANGLAISEGVVQFRPGEMYSYFRVDKGTGSFQIRLSNPSNAALGDRSVFAYGHQPSETARLQ
ncbi:MAG: chitobiase/beta-hexosaminidase C-terminal domain-containing protein [Acidobacteria bacterium]|nr:chitobiase/beta-hexosaminidase C-terminal domain-containing protein [Acidobacteriota bacterium]